MAWTTMHFAVGMGCVGAAGSVACMVCRRGWRWLPGAMTLGGIWALVPDLPRIFREDLYYHPISSILGTHQLERSLHRWGDLFFFHGSLDAQPKEFALLGLLLILLFYNASIVLMMRLEHKQRNSLANRAWRAHRVRQARQVRHRKRTRPPADLPLEPGDPDVIYRIRPNQPSGTDPS